MNRRRRNAAHLNEIILESLKTRRLHNVFYARISSGVLIIDSVLSGQSFYLLCHYFLR